MPSIIRNTCPLCNNPDFYFLRRMKDDQHNLYRCPNCGLDFQCKYSTDILNNYTIEYAERYRVNELVKTFRTEEADWFNTWLSINNVPIKIGLEIGFNTGAFSKRLIEAGWTMRGVELIEDCIESGRKLGIDTISGNWEDINFSCLPAPKATLGILIHTIEHFQNPLSAFQKLCAALTSDALLYIHTPNADHGVPGWFHDHAEHLCLFGRTALDTLFSLCNIEFLESREIHGDDLVFIGRKK